MKKLLFFMLLGVLFYIPTVDAMTVNVQKPDMNTFVVEVESSDTIEAVKEKIYGIDSTFLPHLQILHYNGTKLDDGRTLGDYMVKESDVIVLMLTKYKVILDANGGKFGEKDLYTIDGWDDTSYDNIEVPTRSGYYFTGYYTEKSGGTKLEFILAESGIDNDMTFYAQWDKEVSNPATSSNFGNYVFGLISGFIGIVTLVILRDRKFIF